MPAHAAGLDQAQRVAARRARSGVGCRSCDATRSALPPRRSGAPTSPHRFGGQLADRQLARVATLDFKLLEVVRCCSWLMSRTGVLPPIRLRRSARAARPADRRREARAVRVLDARRALGALRPHPARRPARPRRPDRDRFYLSKGHGPMAYYAVLAAKGFIDPAACRRSATFDSPLGHHPDRSLVPGVEIASGSLGHGLPLAVGAPSPCGSRDGRAARRRAGRRRRARRGHRTTRRSRSPAGSGSSG